MTPAGKASDSLVLRTIEAGLQSRQPDAVANAQMFLRRRMEDYRALEGSRTKQGQDKAAAARSTAEAIQRLINHYQPKINTHKKPSEGIGPTPEASLREYKADPILKLAMAGFLDNRCVSAARDIAEIYEAASSDVMARTSPIFARRSGGPNEPRLERIALKHSLMYKPWTEKMHAEKRFNLPFLIDVIVFGHSISAAREEHRHMASERAKKMLRDALLVYADMWDGQTGRILRKTFEVRGL